MTILIRDRAQDDKVVKVIEPLDTVLLTYDFQDEDRRLGFVKTHWPNYSGIEVCQMHKLYYGDYVTSEDETIKVLKKVQQSTELGDQILDNVQVVRTCPKCPVHDELEGEAQTMANSTIAQIGQMDLDPDYVPNIITKT